MAREAGSLPKRFGTTLVRSLRLKCPNCGERPLFRPFSFRMPPSCANCQLDFEREPGFYLGSIYVNYGITSLAILVAYFVLSLVYKIPRGTKLGICLAIAILLPVLLFRHARSLWLGMDVFVDRGCDKQR